MLNNSKSRYTGFTEEPFNFLSSCFDKWCTGSWEKARIFITRRNISKAFYGRLYPSSFELDVVLCSMCVIPLQQEVALFACLSSGWATTMGRLLGP